MSELNGPRRRRPAGAGDIRRQRKAGSQGSGPDARIQRHRFYRQLLITTVVVVCSFALPGHLTRLTWIGYLGLTALLLRIPGAGRWHRILGCTALLAELLWLFAPQTLRLAGLPLLVVFTVYVGRSLRLLLHALARERDVDGRVLAGATGGYLLLGIAGGLVLTVLAGLIPGSFRDSVSGENLILPALGSLAQAGPLWDHGFQRLNYFAFVTLSTVGYGDVIPTAPVVQVVCIALSVLGPLYMAIVLGVLISRLGSGGPGATGGDEKP